jgi:hypothetical protein
VPVEQNPERGGDAWNRFQAIDDRDKLPHFEHRATHVEGSAVRVPARIQASEHGHVQPQA